MTIKVSSFFMNKHDFTHIQQDNMVLWAEETEMRHNMNHINHLIKYIYRPDIKWWFIKNEGTKHFNTYKVLTIIERRKYNIYTQMRRNGKLTSLLSNSFSVNTLLRTNLFHFPTAIRAWVIGVEGFLSNTTLPSESIDSYSTSSGSITIQHVPGSSVGKSTP